MAKFDIHIMTYLRSLDISFLRTRQRFTESASFAFDLGNADERDTLIIEKYFIVLHGIFKQF